MNKYHLYYLYYLLFPHKIITKSYYHPDTKNINNNLSPQEIRGNTALYYKDDLYPVSREDYDKFYDLIHNNKYDPYTYEYYNHNNCSYSSTLYKLLYYIVSVLEIILSIILIINSINNYSDNKLVALLYCIVALLMITHGGILLSKTIINRNNLAVRISLSQCARVKLRAIIDTQQILSPGLNLREITQDEKLLYLLPRIIIEDSYQEHNYFIKDVLHDPYKDADYQDIINHFAVKYNTNNDIYSILEKFVKQDIRIQKLPGLKLLIYDTIFYSDGYLTSDMMKYHCQLYFSLINKLEDYVKTYPQYLDNAYGHNKLRTLLTISTIKELDKIAYEKKTLSSYSYDIDEVDKDKKEEIGYIFDNTIVNEIWNP